MNADFRLIRQLHEAMMQSLRQEGVLNTYGVESAFNAVPRHLFLPGFSPGEVYTDRAIGIKYEGGLLVSSSSQPTMMAIMLGQLQLRAGDHVLEIGTATGYNAAIMKHIVGERGKITSIEIDGDLAEQAQQNLSACGVQDVEVIHGDGVYGYAANAPYDHIIVTVGVWDIPHAWLEQLKPGGTLVVPITIDGIQVSAAFRWQPDGTLLSIDNRSCSFVYMRGEHAVPNSRRQVGSSSLYILADELNKIDTVGLHALLSEMPDIYNLEVPMTSSEMWYGYQLALMLSEPQHYVFMVYAVIENQQAYGLEGHGVALFTRSSAAFAGYQERGQVKCFSAVDAFMEMQRIQDEWIAAGRPDTTRMRLQLIPGNCPKPVIRQGKLYERREHLLHAWLDL
jgi:protein-L-isoaspartate(D-aspartate) O-methyltransferase